MKNISDIIQLSLLTEALKINSKSKVNTNRNLEDWSILNAEDGDVVELGENLLFIYKGLNKDCHVNNAGPNAIVYHATYICDYRKKLKVGIDTGVGLIDKPNKYKLASEEKREEFYEALKKAGYKWDDVKLKLVKI